MIGTDTGMMPSSFQTLTPRRVIGIDLSMTSTGLAVIANGIIETHTVTSKADAGTLRSFIDRSERIAHQIDEVVQFHGTDLVVIEGLIYHGKSSSLDKINAHWWMVVKFICEYVDQEPVVVNSSQRCKYATGGASAKKDIVLAAVIKRYPQADPKGNDEADAVIFAAMGARHLGYPVEASLPLVNLEAMEAVRWGA
ncbi:crossover junction endodeoxyribonuclease RuvC [Cryobacterium sp. Hh7]|uniref:crossover junction endodeoxyribonuclease RuvC n=1 Tax=Cryobacterium sp. Hh7 TaxID=1259159 RepID=UPI00141BBF3D|nr:crossover junction endodeoxyribonuclease RuvC [Cryobacterium sp. Hh7]